MLPPSCLRAPYASRRPARTMRDEDAAPHRMRSRERRGRGAWGARCGRGKRERVMAKIVETFELYGKEYVLETGELAKQAGGAVVVRQGDIDGARHRDRVSKQPKDLDFFPLTVDFEERMYAAGKLPGGFIKRESRPSEKAILTARMIDRPIRSSFADGFRNEVQVIATVLSADQINQPDVISIMGASAALHGRRHPVRGPARRRAHRRDRGRRVPRQPDLRRGRGLRPRPRRRRLARTPSSCSRPARRRSPRRTCSRRSCSRRRPSARSATCRSASSPSSRSRRWTSPLHASRPGARGAHLLGGRRQDARGAAQPRQARPHGRRRRRSRTSSSPTFSRRGARRARQGHQGDAQAAREEDDARDGPRRGRARRRPQARRGPPDQLRRRLPAAQPRLAACSPAARRRCSRC